MITTLLLLLLLLILSVATAVFVPAARLLVVIVAFILLYVSSYFVWFALQYFQIVPVDELLREIFGIYTHQLVGTWIGQLVMFGPPLIPAVVFFCSCFLMRKI